LLGKVTFDEMVPPSWNQPYISFDTLGEKYSGERFSPPALLPSNVDIGERGVGGRRDTIKIWNVHRIHVK
jgi:hypothetical protein